MKLRAPLLRASLLALAASSSCAPDAPGAEDAGARRDAGSAVDDGGAEAGGPADGGPADGGPADGGDVDGGADGGFVDDGGGPVDAGAVDGGPSQHDDGGVVAPPAAGTRDVLLQGFFWDVPVDVDGRDGFWWDHLRQEAPALAAQGIAAVWIPAPSKGNFGIHDMGYGIFDHYDLGAYEQKGSVETRFGSKAELLEMAAAMRGVGVGVVADVVLNHVYTGDDELERNPVVEAYVAAEAVVDGAARVPFPTAEIVWVIPDAPAGRWRFDVKGYALPWDADVAERAFRIVVRAPGQEDAPAAGPVWADGDEPAALSLGQPGYGFAVAPDDLASFEVVLPQAGRLEARLSPRRVLDDGSLAFSDASRGFRVAAVARDGQPATVEAHTRTGISTPAKTGPGEVDLSWSFAHFRPGAPDDFLAGPVGEDVAERWRAYGHDLRHEHQEVRQRLVDWGRWLTTTVGLAGFRLDFVRGMSPSFVRDFLTSMPPREDGGPRFAVAEYFSHDADAIAAWHDEVAAGPGGASVTVFDFPLKMTLTRMANEPGAAFDMRALATAGLVRSRARPLPASQVVSFVENHDTGKEQRYWVERDHALPHAFVLFAEETPCLFYSHLYGVPLRDHASPDRTVEIPPQLSTTIARLLAVRRLHLGGAMSVLSDVGAPWPAEDARHVFVARRGGRDDKTGAILVLNNHGSEERGLWVDHAPDAALPSWRGLDLVDVTGGVSGARHVYEDGRVFVSAPPRGFAVFMPAGEWVEDEVVPFSPSPLPSAGAGGP